MADLTVKKCFMTCPSYKIKSGQCSCHNRVMNLSLIEKDKKSTNPDLFNYQLVMLPDPVLISDEEIKEGDFKICLNDGQISKYLSKLNIESDTKCEHCFKVIAGIEGLPKIKMSSNAAAIVGWIDVEKLAEEKANQIDWDFESPEGNGYMEYCNGFIDGFKKLQSISEKRFSLEDLSHIFIGENNKGGLFDDFLDYRINNDPKITFKEWFELMNPPTLRIYTVELEMIELYNRFDFDDADGPTSIEPKIVRNAITVTQIISQK